MDSFEAKMFIGDYAPKQIWIDEHSDTKKQMPCSLNGRRIMNKHNFRWWVIFMVFMVGGEPDLWDVLHAYLLRVLQ